MHQLNPPTDFLAPLPWSVQRFLESDIAELCGVGVGEVPAFYGEVLREAESTGGALGSKDLKDGPEHLKTCIEHVFRPVVAYCNGQQAVTVLGDGPYEVAFHGSVAHLLEFAKASDFATLPFKPSDLAEVPSRSRAEDLARKFLREHLVVKERRIAETNEVISLQKWGDWIEPDGYRSHILIVQRSGVRELVRVVGEPCSESEPLKVYRSLGTKTGGGTVSCCANCNQFEMSGMTQEMSGGSVGYCRIAKREQGVLGTVHVSHVCPLYTQGSFRRSLATLWRGLADGWDRLRAILGDR